MTPAWGGKMSVEAASDLTACRASLRSRQERQYQARERRRLAARLAVIAAVRSVLPRFPSVRRVYLFGSVLRPGGMRSVSDVDLAVEGDLAAEDYFALWRELERAAGEWPLDVVDLDRHARFAARVRAAGELVYECPDPYPESGHHSRPERDR